VHPGSRRNLDRAERETADFADYTDWWVHRTARRTESNIQPADTLTIGRSQVSASVRNQVGQREFWPYVAAAALAILLVEWWVYHRGSSLPAVSGWRGWLQRKKAGT